MRRNVTLATVAVTAFATVLAAIGGSYVGGSIASSATRDVVNQQIEHDERRLEDEARGAARVLVAEIYTAAKEMKDLGLDGYFRPFNDDYRVDVAQADLRLIAYRLTSDQWTYVTVALDTVIGLGRYVAFRSRPSHPLSGEPLPPHTLALISSDMRVLGRAVSALRPLADLEDEGFPTLEGGPSLQP